MARNTRRTRLTVESLEDRKLLNARIIAKNGKPINDKDLKRALLQIAQDVPVADRRIAYTTPGGESVILTLFGAGTLKGTTVNPDGSLNLVYDNTDVNTRITAHVAGGSGQAPLAGIRDADSPPRSAAATGVNPVGRISLPAFNLIDGGYINLAAGISGLVLNSLGRDTQLHLKANPEQAAQNQNANNVGLLTGVTIIGGNVSTTPAASGTVTSGGTTAGTTVTGTSLVTGTSTSTTPAAPTGIGLFINHVNAGPLGTPPLGPPQIMGFDPTTSTLIRFDATTGKALMSIPVPPAGTPIAGVGLGRDNTHLVALVGSDSIIRAFDVITGAPMGQFSTANLAAVGLTRIDGIGSTDVKTYVSDSTAGPDGLILPLNITASLAAGVAVPAGAVFAPVREFELTGGVTGLPGTDVVFAVGAAHFDSFQPNLNQLGTLAFSTSSKGVTTEAARTAIPSGVQGNPFINAGPPHSLQAQPLSALGSVDSDLALIAGVARGGNVLNLYNPNTLAADGSVLLQSPNLLTGLSESFHPELMNAALIDVVGNLKKYVGMDARGLVINDNGVLNLVAIRQATDTTVIGRPLLHVAIPIRQNVQLLSNARGTNGTDTSGGVLVNDKFRPAGPLSLP